MKAISIFRCVAVKTERGCARSPSRSSHDIFRHRGWSIGLGGAPLFALAVWWLSAFATLAQVNRTIGTLPPGGVVTITFDVTINNSFPGNTASVTNQGSVSGSGFGPILTSDPATGVANTPTVTAVLVPPLITSATNATFTVGINGVFHVLRTGVPTPDLFISGTIPNNVGFNPGTGNLSGTPLINRGGAYPLVITATNAVGTNVQNFTLEVLESPLVTCPPNVTTNNAPGQCARTLAFAATITRGYPTPVATYKIGTNLITSPYAFPVGTNVVDVTATNGVPADKNCSFTFIVKDTEPPTPTCPADIVVTNIAGNCPAVVNYSVSGTDNCGTPAVVANPPSGSTFALGTNTVTLLATDAAGNTNTCTFNVTVLPGPPPPFSISQVGTNVVLCWSNIFNCYSLQYTPQLLSPPATNVWTVHPGPYVPSGGNIYVTNDITITNRFFRLAY